MNMKSTYTRRGGGGEELGWCDVSLLIIYFEDIYDKDKSMDLNMSLKIYK